MRLLSDDAPGEGDRRRGYGHRRLVGPEPLHSGPDPCPDEPAPNQLEFRPVPPLLFGFQSLDFPDRREPLFELPL